MIFSIIERKKYLYGASRIFFSQLTFLTSLWHTGDNFNRRFRRHFGGRGLTSFQSLIRASKYQILGSTKESCYIISCTFITICSYFILPLSNTGHQQVVRTWTIAFILSFRINPLGPSPTPYLPPSECQVNPHKTFFF